MFDAFNKKPNILERILDGLDELADRVDVFYESPLRVGLLEALIAGGFLTSIFCVLNGTENAYETWFSTFYKIVFPTMSSFVIAAFLHNRLLTGPRGLIMPSWLVISVLGTWLALTIQAIPGATLDWNTSFAENFSLIDYVSKWTRVIIGMVAFMSVIVMPLTAGIHYLGTLLRGLRS